MTTRRKTNICLNMIVKNETTVLDRLFSSVKDYIDYYVIVDTGSTDGTQQLIKTRMSEYGIEGEVHDRPWVNFGVNRQQALELAVRAGRSDWLLFIDADEELGVSNPRFYEELQPGVTYDIAKQHQNIRYLVPHLVNVRATEWCWKGPVHNYLEHVRGSTQRAARDDVWIIYHQGEGAKSQGVTSEEKYLRDAQLLEDELERNPGDPRSQFYLGQSYKHAGRLEQAFEAYKVRSKQEGWAEETFMAQLEAGRVAKLMNKTEGEVVSELLQAYQLRPSRAEPLYELASYYRPLKMYAKAHLFAKAGLAIEWPDDKLFVAHDVYNWRLLDEIGVCAYWMGRYEEARGACEEVLRRARGGVSVPEADLERIRQNLGFSKAKLAT
ncbi:MAG: glycosyltransferase [Mycolicibacterium sp.]|uniref:glycosyltransferase n=1 Tax=Mycolicibacterium sp. TaxID=2320850 RepID=UPI003D121521